MNDEDAELEVRIKELRRQYDKVQYPDRGEDVVLVHGRYTASQHTQNTNQLGRRIPSFRMDD